MEIMQILAEPFLVKKTGFPNLHGSVPLIGCVVFSKISGRRWGSTLGQSAPQNANTHSKCPKSTLLYLTRASRFEM